MNTHSEYDLDLTMGLLFDNSKPAAEEISIVAALMPELMAAFVNSLPDAEE